MRGSAHDPRRLDVGALARSGEAIEGRWPIAELERLAGSVLSIPAGAAVAWHASGHLERRTGAEPQACIDLAAHASVVVQCQRCLEPLPMDLIVERRFRFAADERAAQALDAEIEDDVLAMTPALDLRQLVEDELLLALPLVPRHEHCATPLGRGATANAEPRASPFRILETLRNPRGGD
jgi:uncharacterized protein